MAMFFLVVVATGLPAIVGPAPLTAAVTEMSVLVTSKVTNTGLTWNAPKAIVHETPVLSISSVPARGENGNEAPSEVATEAHDFDTVTVSDSAHMSEYTSSALPEEPIPEDAHAHAEQVGHDIFAAQETLAEEAPGGEDVADEAAQPEVSEVVVSSDSPSTPEVMDSMSVESVQAEEAEDQNVLEQSDEVEIETTPVAPEHVETELTSIPVVPQDVETEVTSLLVAPEDIEIEVGSIPMEKTESFVTPDSPQIEQVEKCAPKSLFPGSPASCSMI